MASSNTLEHWKESVPYDQNMSSKSIMNFFIIIDSYDNRKERIQIIVILIWDNM